MIIDVLIVFGFTALVFMWYHRVRSHNRKLWKPWAVLADIFIAVACVFQFLMKISQGNAGEAKVDLLFAFLMIICTWVEYMR